MRLSASVPAGGTRTVTGPRSWVARSSRSGWPSKTMTAFACRPRQKAATRRTTSGRRSSPSFGPPQEPRRLLPSIRYGTTAPRSDADQPAQEAAALRALLHEDLVQLAGIEEDALAERTAV